ncbi:hypothetical protein ACFS7Z_25670 [Pontibacter toksunensis]|uniref:Uncharacterized protein n=1 Tax=Pontibacter toksunensis TaxID=1332631 RepID=A0ABW6C2W9_9BACT
MQPRILHKAPKEKEEEKREKEPLIQEQKERAEKARRNYNRFFQENTGYL